MVLDVPMFKHIRVRQGPAMLVVGLLLSGPLGSLHEVIFKLVLGGMVGVAHFITGHEQTQYNLVCYFYFHFFDVVLASKGSN